jgi:hypothetical protein
VRKALIILLSSVCVNVSDTIPGYQEEGILKGHGTADLNGEVVATLCGVVERVNKLVLVRTLRARSTFFSLPTSLNLFFFRFSVNLS